MFLIQYDKTLAEKWLESSKKKKKKKKKKNPISFVFGFLHFKTNG